VNSGGKKKILELEEVSSIDLQCRRNKIDGGAQ